MIEDPQQADIFGWNRRPVGARKRSGRGREPLQRLLWPNDDLHGFAIIAGGRKATKGEVACGVARCRATFQAASHDQTSTSPSVPAIRCP